MQVRKGSVTMPLFTALIKPLRCPEIEPDFECAPLATPERLLDWLFTPDVQHAAHAQGCAEFVARYREIDAVPEKLIVAPVEENLLQKLIWPLRHAKGSYALGNYIGCIALCGMVGEMAAILLWDISKVSLEHKPLDKMSQRDLLGHSFEELGQARRTQVLRVLGLIEEKDKEAFDGLSHIRNKYLHLFSKSHSQVNIDARRAYEHALDVINLVLGQSLDSIHGGIALRPELMTYLEERGIIGTQPERKE
jgi:hypothetical protein